MNVGLAGLEPATLRLSSACSNQLSYRPGIQADRCQVTASVFGGGKGIRTPDIQLAKLALYQLSYAPGKFELNASFLILENQKLNCVERRVTFIAFAPIGF